MYSQFEFCVTKKQHVELHEHSRQGLRAQMANEVSIIMYFDSATLCIHSRR